MHAAWEYKAQGVTAAQMNIFFGLAAIAVDGEAFIHQYREDRLSDPRLLDVIRRTTCVIDPELDAMGPLFRHSARVVVKTRDGRSFTLEMLHRLGIPENPLTAQAGLRQIPPARWLQPAGRQGRSRDCDGAGPRQAR